MVPGKLPAARGTRGLPSSVAAGADYAEVKGDGTIGAEIADSALNMLNVDQRGFDHQDRRLLLTLMEKFEGGPVGVDSPAAALSEERAPLRMCLNPT